MSVVPYVEPSLTFSSGSTVGTLPAFADTLEQFFVGQLATQTSTQAVINGFGLDALPATIVLTGTGFTYGVVNGRTVLTGGTVTYFQYSGGGAPNGTIAGPMSAAEVFSTLSLVGEPRQHISDYFLSFNYSLFTPQGSNGAELFGGAGNDTLVAQLLAGPSNNTLHGGAGFDTASFGYATNGVTIDFSAGRVFNGQYISILDSIEHVFGSSTDGDRMIGSYRAESFSGLAGDDYVVDAGAGADLLDGGSGHDILGYYRSLGVVIDLTAGTVIDGSTGQGQGSVDRVEGFEEVYGSSTGADSYQRGTAGADTFWGFGGADYIIAADPGADAYHGGDGFDTLDYFYAQGAVVNLTAGTAVDGTTGFQQGSTDTLDGIEQVYGSFYYADVLIGDDADNQLWGFGGDDFLVGRGGSDTLNGGTGNDYFAFSIGEDFQAGVWDTVFGFQQGPGGFDRLYFVGVNPSDLIFGEANGGTYVSTKALGGTGGFFVVGATQLDISDQLVFA